MPSYILVHNGWYDGLYLVTSLFLLSLAFVEEPALPLFKVCCKLINNDMIFSIKIIVLYTLLQVPVWAHGTAELIALIIISVELALKLRWTGWDPMLKHKRTMLKVRKLLYNLKSIYLNRNTSIQNVS